MEEEDKSTLTYQEPVPWPSLMDVFVGHQHWKPNPLSWPLQSVPRLVGSGCCVKAKQKAYNLYTARAG